VCRIADLRSVIPESPTHEEAQHSKDRPEARQWFNPDFQTIKEGNMSRSRLSSRTPLLHFALAAAAAALLAVPLAADAQERSTVRGTVTDAQTLEPLAGVAVQVVGTNVGTVTNASGGYMVQAPADGSLRFSRLGYQVTQVGIAGRERVDVGLTVEATRLEELVATGYTTQRRGDITAAVASVNTEAIERQTSASVLQRLAGTVSGLTVDAGGSPGTRNTVRIRGVSSFQNNDPLYIIDGVPVVESYANFLNPNDVESIQVLKDASAASIYGARANNGVIIINTKRGRVGAPQISVDAQFGVGRPYRGYDDFLMTDALEWFEFEKRRYVNAGLPIPQALTQLFGDPNNPSVPRYIYAAPGTITGRDPWGRPTVDETLYSFPAPGGNANCCLIMPGSAGTNWFGEVFSGSGAVRDINVAVRGGTENARYNVSFGVFDHEGTAIGNRFQRGTARVNTSFTMGRFTIGENLTIALEENWGGLGGDGLGEGNIMGKNILSAPVIPVRDINGNWASGKGTGLGNNTNPVKIATLAQDNRNRFNRIFGNTYARLAITDALSANSSLGVSTGNGSYRGFNDIYPENSEPTMTNGIFEGQNHFTEYTWNNTLNFRSSLARVHNLDMLVGQEAIWGRSRNMDASISGLVSTDINARYIQGALANPNTRAISSGGGTSSLLSVFGQANYNFAERYYLSGTLRRDGSSRLGPENRWGTFPAFSLGWRVSNEAFLAGSDAISNLMLRFGWGVTGNQNITAGRVFSGFGGSVATSFYDVGGTGSSAVTGYRQTTIGNPDLKWEENTSANVGMDLEFLNGRAMLAIDLYQRDTDNLLFNPPLPATAGQAAAPIQNVGAMRNRGLDAQFGLRGRLGNGIGWTLDLNGATYRNEIVRIAGEQLEFGGPIGIRNGAVVINRVGHPIGSFYGLKHAGIFQSQQEIDQLNAQARQRTGRPDAVFQAGAAPGRFRFEDVDGDGVVTAADRTIIGSPHPDFTAGLNLGLTWRSLDFGANVFGSFGNDIFEAQKEFYVFRNFPVTVRRDVLTDSWTPQNTNAKYPILDANDSFSQQVSSFYVEDGSYVRLRNLQVGYTLPSGRFGGVDNVRIYVRGENLFTITGYPGLDPSLPALAAGSAAGDVRDQARGIDRGSYPTSRTLSVGFNVGF
jgi:TonB-dependent starch-binding outer membrane protein SusC